MIDDSRKDQGPEYADFHMIVKWNDRCRIIATGQMTDHTISNIILAVMREGMQSRYFEQNKTDQEDISQGMFRLLGKHGAQSMKLKREHLLIKRKIETFEYDAP